MESNVGDGSEILREIESLKASKKDIDARISALEAELRQISLHNNNDASCRNYKASFPPIPNTNHNLPPDAIYRYSRHLLLPSFGVQGQSNLLNSSVLVVGAGGLGSPALLYLAACGVGCLGIVDHDVVELNNMHRQIIHTETYIGRPKVESAASACNLINSTVKIVEYKEALRTSNALEIFSKYDVIIDATDNVPSRYMISDCCVLLGKPLVSGAALGFEGQLTVYNYKGGPCYRCLFPSPPPTTACQRCSDSGVLGVVPGVIGTLQALEAIKIGSGVGEPLSGKMFLFDALSGRIRMVKIRGRSLQCEVCGENSAFTQAYFREFDYEKFTQSPLSTAPPRLNLLPPHSRVSCKDYSEKVVGKEKHVLIDVRPAHHFNIVSLPKSLSIPLLSLESRLSEITAALNDETTSGSRLYVVCRRGNDSQRAVQLLHKMGFSSAMDIVGGLEAWAQEVDPTFPAY
ncbi:Adenylyltransferase and sulfurtransferase MOCS3 [Ancistrocladus abbreviatus]